MTNKSMKELGDEFNRLVKKREAIELELLKVKGLVLKIAEAKIIYENNSGKTMTLIVEDFHLSQDMDCYQPGMAGMNFDAQGKVVFMIEGDGDK
jgi:hypothetical protein